MKRFIFSALAVSVFFVGHGAGVGVGAEGNFTVVVRKPDGTTEELTGADAQKWIATRREGNDDGRQIVIKKVDGANAEPLKIGDATAEGVVVRKMKSGDG